MFNLNERPEITDSGPFSYPESNIELYIRRLELIDPVYGGNKWFKLKYNILKIKEKGYKSVVTFGGAYSNHIAAVARVGKICGIPTTGIIRGETNALQNQTLTRAHEDGMHLIFCSREKYRQKTDPGFLNAFLPDTENYMVIPEGGSNLEGINGAKEIISDKDQKFDAVTVACGTGATAAGLILNMKSHQHLFGINVLRGNNGIKSDIEKWTNHYDGPSWSVENDYHFGGYGKSDPILNLFVETFEVNFGIKIEPVYTGKMFFGLEQIIKSGKIKQGSKVLAIHTGGLQYLG
ncbi:MAG TPA: pyridoxal-phosphate dependent enzyme [Bacteroidia bacterium]|nr:pyridoxal-phosphate dependent enzyme [Bacteroidia bacterium]